MNIKKKIGACIIVGLVLMFIAGIIILLSAVGMGRDAADAIIRANGGSMDTDKFNMLMRSSMIGFQVMGAIVSLLGGVGSIAFAYQLYKEA